MFQRGKISPEYYGDNIYEPTESDPTGFKKVSNAFHCEESKHKHHDLSGKNVIICNEFYYFSAKNAFEIPEDIRNGFNNLQRGHKYFYGEEKTISLASFVKFFNSEMKNDYVIQVVFSGSGNDFTYMLLNC